MSSNGSLSFGVFLAPHHPYNMDPALALRKDLHLIEYIDDLGFEEAWVGEHHSGGHEITAAPDQFLAAAAERTKHVRLGTGVVSMSYHHPLVTAGRITQLDNLTRGRIIFGTGPGKLASDAYMMGIDPMVQRHRQREAVEACVALLNGEVVNMETDWFTLRDARLQLLPYHGAGALEMAAASIISPSGPSLCGTYGLSLLSLAAATPQGFDALPKTWKVYEEVSAANGREVQRDRWRLMSPVFLAESRAAVDEAVERRLRAHVRYTLSHLLDEGDWTDATKVPPDMEWTTSPRAALEHWRVNGWPAYGRGVFGPPEEAIERIEELQLQTGGFGTFLIMAHDVADTTATYRSLELFAEQVIPHFKPHRNRNRVESLEWTEQNKHELFGVMKTERTAAQQEYEASR